MVEGGLSSGILTVAVISDPHFFVFKADSEHSSPSHNKITEDGKLYCPCPNTNPWADLKTLVGEHEITADLLVCPGDVTVAADDTGLTMGWANLNELGTMLKAGTLICATGNHDVRSRGMAKLIEKDFRHLQSSTGIFEGLKMLKPIYPIVNASANEDDHIEFRTQYFGASFVLHTNDRYRVLVINSCCEHGNEPVSYETSAFPESSLDMLEKALKRDPSPKTNICVMHHPPAVHAYLKLGAHDALKNGQEVLKRLEQHGSWLIIHGHKHHGHVSYAQGGQASPIIFSAASLAARMEATSEGRRNQFYLLNIDISNHDEIRGTIRAWDWFEGVGWKRATMKDGGIYDGCGFGYRQSLNQLAANIAAKVTAPCDWHEVVERYPELNFLTPQDLNWLSERLRTQHQRAITPNDEGDWAEYALAKS